MNRIKSALTTSIDLPFFTVVIFLKILSFNLVLGLVDLRFYELILGCLGSTLLIVSLLCLLNVKHRLRLMLILDFIISLLLFTDIVYNRYFHDVTSVALIRQVGLVGEVKDSVGALIKPSDLLLFLDIVIFIPLYLLIKNRIDLHSAPKIRTRIIALILLFLAGLFFANGSVKALEKNQPGILKTFYDKKYIVQHIGELNFHMIDLYKYVTTNVLKIDKLSDSEKQDVKDWLGQKNSNSGENYKNIMQGKNLIIVQLESFQNFVLYREINGQQITPNLNELSKNSLVFDNYYYQTAWGGTSDAELLSNASLLPAREGSAYYQYAGNAYDSIISSLKDKGYYTSVMHANRPGFWNRVEMYKSFGFDKFFSENDYNIDDIQGMGLSDKSFFKQSVKNMQSLKQPFYSFLITLSSHFPYKDSQDRIKDILNVGEFEGTTMGDYLKSVKYTDEAIGEFIAELKDAGLWDNSVVVFYGDHSAIPYDQKQQLAKLVYNKDDISDFEWFKAQKVVSMIHFPGDAFKGHNEMTAGQMDLYPTIANLFGAESKYALGRDLLNSKDGFILNKDGVWANDEVAYLKSIDKLVDIKTGQELNKNDYQSLFNTADDYINNSNAILENNLIKYFETDAN